MRYLPVHIFMVVVTLITCHLFGSNTRGEKGYVPAEYAKPKAAANLTLLEIPAAIADEEIVQHIGYTVSYNHKTLLPNWVAYELTDEETRGELRGKESFQWDPDLKGVQPNREDYKNDQEWDRGHMAPKADMKWSTEAYEQSYYLTNICPQNRKFNAGDWAATERMGRRIAQQYGSVYIVCGPIVGDNVNGSLSEKHIIIPDKFFKAFLIKKEDNTYSTLAFIMNNSPEKQNLKASSMSVNRLENLIGMDLFCNLPRKVQDDVEGNIVYKDWGI